MNLSAIRDRLPDSARDLRLNLDLVLSEAGAPGLDARRIAFVASACALACRQPMLREAVLAAAAERLTAAELEAARTCAALMAMNNVYYRFTHLVGDESYRALPARLRMSAIANPGVDRVSFELGSLAVSAIHGCGACVAAHEAALRAHGLGQEAIQSAARIAAVIHAVAVTLDGAKSEPPLRAAA